MKSHGVDTKTAAFGLHVVEILFFHRGFGLFSIAAKQRQGPISIEISNGPMVQKC